MTDNKIIGGRRKEVHDVRLSNAALFAEQEWTVNENKCQIKMTCHK